GAINAGAFRPSQARILLAAALATGTDSAEVFRQSPDPKRYREA
ncbi:hypothetical protein HMPREF0277_1698, partial [Corynebacterium accolens ATCC 49726]